MCGQPWTERRVSAGADVTDPHTGRFPMASSTVGAFCPRASTAISSGLLEFAASLEGVERVRDGTLAVLPGYREVHLVL